MSGKTPAAAQLTQYLLGQVSPSERERLESEYFSNDDTFREMLSAEDDLIDAYARGQLSATERRQFEERFLNSVAGRERVQFARTLAGFVADARPSEEPVPYQPGFFASLQLPGASLRFAVVGVLLALALATTWLLVQQGRLRNELQTLRTERDSLNQRNEELRQSAAAEQARNADSAAQLEKLKQQLAVKTQSDVNNSGQKYASYNQTKPRQPKQDATPGRTSDGETVAQSSAVFDLSPGAVRSQGGARNTVSIPKNAKSIVLRLGLENTGYKYYRAVVETVDGSPVRRFGRFKAPGPTRTYQSVQLPPIPASALPVGVYLLSLQGQQSDGSFVEVSGYSFTVKRDQ